MCSPMGYSGVTHCKELWTKTNLQVEQGVLLVSLPLVEGALTPPTHGGAHDLHVGLGQSDTLFQVSHHVPGGLNVRPGTCVRKLPS